MEGAGGASSHCIDLSVRSHVGVCPFVLLRQPQVAVETCHGERFRRSLKSAAETVRLFID